MKKAISIILCAVLVFSTVGFCFATSDTTEGYVRMATFKEALYSLFHRREILNTDYIGEESTDVWSPDDEYRLEDTFVLQKEEGKDFVILNFTDTHFADYDYRAFTAFLASATMKRLVKKVRPDLITITGDIVCTDSSVFAVKRITDLMNSFETPWAPVFGNHDAEGNCDANYLADIMMKSPYCLFKKGDPSMGCGNYIINICEGAKVANSILMMDTHGSHLNEMQIEWYKWAANGIQTVTGEKTETTVFYHIPNAEYQYAHDAAWDSEKGTWKEGFAASGECNEKICCPRDADGNPVPNGFFEAVKEVGTTKNIFCGHEHMNNFSILYEDIRMTYTLKVGMASGFQFGFNGGTKIVIADEGVSFEHLYSL